jgi:hypothetical protein
MRTSLLAFLCLLGALNYSPWTNAATVDLKKSAPGMVEHLVDSVQAKAPSFECMGIRVKPEVTCKSAVFTVERLLTTVEMNVRYRLHVADKILCDETSVATFSYDLLAKQSSVGKVQFRTKLGSFEIPMSTLEVILANDLSKPVALIRAFGLVKRGIWSDYDEQKKNYIEKYGAENVYFASTEFVRWATPETAGRWVIEKVASGGTACDTVAIEAQVPVRQEIQGITAWLEKKTQSKATEIACKLLSCQPVASPGAAIRVVWQPVRYKSRLTVAGKKIGGPIEVAYAAFVFIWSDASNPLPR